LTGFENSLGSHPRKKRGFEKSKLVLKDFWDFKLSFVPTLNQAPIRRRRSLMIGAGLSFFVARKSV
jgi:hypothetical protein